MAEGGQDINLWEEFSFHGTPEPPHRDRSITVLSWNINGKSGSLAEPRNLLTHRVVRYVNPDVLLLQETKTDLQVNKIDVRTYHQEKARDEHEARVLYDPRVFEMPEEVNLDDMVARVFPPEQQREMEGVQDTFKNRVAAVRLKHKDTERQIIFMSFHNIYVTRDNIHSNVMAKRFCQIVADNTEPEDTLVVAGADLNCDRNDFYHDQATHAHVPNCNTTQRRERAMQQSGPGKKPKVIDYFVAKSHNITTNGRVSALDIINAHAFSRVWQDLNDHMRKNGLTFTQKNYNDSLDHDPLVYYLTL